MYIHIYMAVSTKVVSQNFIGIMGSNKLALLGRGSVFGKKEKARVCAP